MQDKLIGMYLNCVFVRIQEGANFSVLLRKRPEKYHRAHRTLIFSEILVGKHQIRKPKITTPITEKVMIKAIKMTAIVCRINLFLATTS